MNLKSQDELRKLLHFDAENILKGQQACINHMGKFCYKIILMSNAGKHLKRCLLKRVLLYLFHICRMEFLWWVHGQWRHQEAVLSYLIFIAGVAEIILRTQTKLSLKCMAAKAVKTYNLTYQGQVPQSLESFIELHGPGVKQGWL
jgi:hypothetical protein